MKKRPSTSTVPSTVPIRASFSQERLSYDARTATVVYKGKDGRRQKRFDALKWRKRA